jgi:hypothetical protein
MAAPTEVSDPASEPEADQAPWYDGIGIVLALLAIVFALQLMRQQGTHSWQTVWAEDAKYYGSQAIRQGGLHVLFQGYAGYLQLPPRLIAAFAPLIPLRSLSLYYALVGTLVGTLLAWFLYDTTEGWISSRLLRVVLAALLVLMPAAGKENTANVVNLIWTFLAVLPWALVSRQEGRNRTALRAVVVFLAATSTPLAAVFLPLALAWIFFHRTRSAITVGASLVVGLAVQGLVILHTAKAVGGTGNSLSHLADTLAVRVFAFYAVGTKGVITWWVGDGTVLMVASTLGVVVVFALLFPGAGRRAQGLAAAFLAYAVAIFTVPAWGRGLATVYPPPGMDFHLSSTRFSVVPVLLIASAAFVLVAPRSLARRRRPVARVALPLLVIQLVIVGLFSYPAQNAVSVGPTWSQLIDATYAANCVGRPPDQPVNIDNGGSKVHLLCKDLKP